jgi:transposase
MTFSKDLRWRAVVLSYVYDIDIREISIVLGVSQRTVARWNAMFQQSGNVLAKSRAKRQSRWPSNVCAFVEEYLKDNPCFYLEELQMALKHSFQGIATSTSTICRALKFDLGLTRKVLTKRAKEAKKTRN